MTKTQIKRDLLQGNEGAIPMHGRGIRAARDRARDMLKDLQYDPRGNAKMYYIDDVAEVFAERRTL